MERSCCCHVLLGNDSDVLVPFTDKSWSSFCIYVEKWKQLDGRERTVAENFARACKSKEECTFHRTCYSYFVNARRIAQAEVRKDKGKRRLDITFNSEGERAEYTSEPPEKRRLRSANRSCVLHNAERRNVHILPVVCIFCKKQKTVLNKLTKKRNRECLVSCETNAQTLLRACELKNDENLLLHLRDKDPVSIEVKYHRSCYKSYVRCVSKAKQDVKQMPNNSAFEKFCHDVIDTNILKNGEVFAISTLSKMYMKYLNDTGADSGSCDDLPYRNYCLKRRLQNRYRSQLEFLQLHSHQCEIVIVAHTQPVILNVQDKFVESTSDSEWEEGNNNCDGQYGASKNNFQYKTDLYHAALILQKTIAEVKSIDTWPATADELTVGKSEQFVPTLLFNFISWCVGASDEVAFDRFVNVGGMGTKEKILSISQDLISLHSAGRKLTPKQLALGLTLRHLTGSSKIINLMNGFGHCPSHSFVVDYDNALAHQQLLKGSSIPPGFYPRKFTILVWDNNDFGEETLSGKGTTHNTNGIIIQRRTDSSERQPVFSLTAPGPAVPRSAKRTFPAPSSKIIEFVGKPRHGPAAAECPAAVNEPDLTSQEASATLDLAYWMCKTVQIQDSSLPGWTGFNHLLAKDAIPPVCKIGYLPVIDASPTDLSTVNTLLHESISIANKLLLPSIVLVMDQAVYCKAQVIRWQNREFCRRLIIRLGEFHTAMAFLGVIGKRFKDAGLEDMAVESGIVAEGSINGVISGHEYNRSIRCHKVIAEALQHLRITEFLEQLSAEDCSESLNTIISLHSSFPEGFIQELKSEKVLKLQRKYQNHVLERSKENINYAFWSSYLSMVELLLQFLRGTREGNWNLHLAAVRDMIPWFFSYGKINYSRYLPIYFQEMSMLPEMHPSIYKKFCKGQFAIQRQSEYGFSLTAADQVIEQTFNRDSKTKGGLVGFTLNKGAVARWILSHPMRTAIANSCFEQAGRSSKISNIKELSAPRIQQDMDDVNHVLSTVRSVGSPFRSGSDKQLINLMSGRIATDEINLDLMQAYDRGNEAYQQFQKERLTEGKKNVFVKISLPKCKTFSDMSAKGYPKATLASMSVKESRDLFARMLSIAQSRQLDLQEALSYPLSTCPNALANYDGSMTKTNKAVLIHHLEAAYPEAIVEWKKTDDKTAVLIDAMAMLQMQVRVPVTMLELATTLLNQILAVAISYNARRVDFVADRYPTMSIKGQERERRGDTYTSREIRILRPEQKTPTQFRSFLSSGKNKESLVKFLLSTWKVLPPETFKNITIFVTDGPNCYKLHPAGDMLQMQEAPELFCDHEEADTRLFLHASHAFRYFSCSNVIIRSPDTDVLVLAVHTSHMLPGKVYMQITGQHSRTLDVSFLSSKIGEKPAAALLGFHVFSGCDSVSSFRGKGKRNLLKVMQGNPQHVAAFSELGLEWALSKTLFQQLEKFTAEVYGVKDCSDINTARYRCFLLGHHTDRSLPPNQDSLMLHTARTNYQLGIYKRCLQQLIDPPDPAQHGWFLSDGRLDIRWSTMPLAPDCMLQVVRCGCQKSPCDSNRCSCRSSKLSCTSMCKCPSECTNKPLQSE